MSYRCFAGAAALFFALAPARLAGQRWTLQRTADGQPDLQGVWSTATLTPLERPPEFAGREFLTAQEAADYERLSTRSIAIAGTEAPRRIFDGTITSSGETVPPP